MMRRDEVRAKSVNDQNDSFGMGRRDCGWIVSAVRRSRKWDRESSEEESTGKDVESGEVDNGDICEEQDRQVDS